MSRHGSVCEVFGNKRRTGRSTTVKWDHSLEKLLVSAICAMGGETESWTWGSEWRQLKLWLSVLYCKGVHPDHDMELRDSAGGSDCTRN